MPRSKNQRPTTLEQAFGQVLLARREKKGFSQMDLAVAAGYSLRYMGDVERGAKSATMRTMNDLATLLDVSLGTLVVEAEELLNGKPKPTKKSLHRLKGQ
ncbi:MAG TPA: helix-turn-helix transcriptional regulator [Acidobacteriaceae bacterium]